MIKQVSQFFVEKDTFSLITIGETFKIIYYNYLLECKKSKKPVCRKGLNKTLYDAKQFKKS